MSYNQESVVAKYGALVNNPATDKLLQNLGSGYKVGKLTYFDNKIYDCDGAISIEPETLLVKNVNLYHKRKILGAAGDVEGAEKIAMKHIFGEKYLGALERSRSVAKTIHDNPGVPVHRILGAAAGLISTDYETVRRANYLMEVKGPTHNMDKYNAINAVTVQNTADLNVIGFARSSKLGGLKEIGDTVTPDVAKNAYTSYTKYLLADAFHWQFTMREIRDSVFPLDAQVRQDLPGIFAELKDGKITDGANAVSNTTAPSTNWLALLATYETHYTYHAEDDVGDADSNIGDYGGVTHILWPRAVRNAYVRNIGGKVTQNVDSLALAEQGTRGNPRIQELAMNPGIIGIQNESITAASLVAVNKGQWATLLQGPVVQVTYQNQMTPGQVAGNIIFDFNGFKEQVSSAARQLTGLLS